MKSLTKIDKAMETMTLCLEAVYDEACKQRDAAAKMVDLNSDNAGGAVVWGQILDDANHRVHRLVQIKYLMYMVKRDLAPELRDVSTEFASNSLKLRQSLTHLMMIDWLAVETPARASREAAKLTGDLERGF